MYKDRQLTMKRMYWDRQVQNLGILQGNVQGQTISWQRPYIASICNVCPWYKSNLRTRGNVQGQTISWQRPYIAPICNVCPWYNSNLRTLTELLMDGWNFISALRVCTGYRHFNCITRYKKGFETLINICSSRAASSQLKTCCNQTIWYICYYSMKETKLVCWICWIFIP